MIRYRKLFVSSAVLLAITFQPAVSSRAEDLNQSAEQVIADLQPLLEQVQTFEYHKYGDDLLQKLEAITYRATDDAVRQAIEASVLEAIPQSNTLGKQILCRQLHWVGGEASISVLEELLRDADVSHTARYALASFDGPGVDEALLRAAQDLSGDLKVGVLNSLAARRAVQAVPVLAQSLISDEPTVRTAAADALGRIGGRAAAEALKHAPTDKGPSRIELQHALLGCAESLAADDGEAAVAIYQQLLDDPVTEQVKFAAFRGLFLHKQGSSAALLRAALDDPDTRFRAFAVQLVNEVDSDEAIHALTDLLKTADNDTKVAILRAMSDRGDNRFESAVLECLAASDQVDVSKEALFALGEVGSTRSISTLLSAASKEPNELKSIAASSLRNLHGESIDSALIQTASNGDNRPELRIGAVEAIAGRKTHDAIPTMLALANSDSEPLRRAAVNTLAVIGTTAELPALCQLAVARSDASEQAAVVDACRQILQRIEDPVQIGQLTLQQLSATPVDSQAILCPLLALAGSDKSYEFVQSAVERGTPELRQAALATMKLWPNGAPTPELLAAFKSPRSADERKLALEGCLHMAQYSDAAPELFRQLLQQASTDEERKQILGGMGEVGKTAAMIHMADEHFNNPALRATAGLAMVHISNRLRQSDEDAAIATLEKVIEQVDHPDVRQRALNVVKEIEKQEGWITAWKLSGPYQHEDAGNADQIHAMKFGPEVSGATVEWTNVPTEAIDGESRVDLERAFAASLDHCTAYLASEVWADEAGDYLFQVQVDDLCSLSVNGEEVIGKRGSHADGIPVTLTKGWNSLLLKVSDHEGGWNFKCRFRNLAGRKPIGMKFQAERAF